MRGRIFAFFLLMVLTPKMGWSQSVLNFPKLFTAAELASSGFTIVNPSSTTATVTFTLFADDGHVVATAPPATFAPGTQQARLGAGTGQIFGTISPGSGGWVQASSPTSGLTAFWLTFDANFSNLGDG